MAHYKVKSMAVADVCASKLLRIPKIQDYLATLRQPAEKAVIATRDELGETYTTLFKDSEKGVRDRVACGKEIAGLYGYYAPQKNLILGDITIEVIYKDATK